VLLSAFARNHAALGIWTRRNGQTSGFLPGRCALLLLPFGQSIHPEDPFSRFHEIELVSSQEFEVVRIGLEQGEFLTLFVVQSALAGDRLFQCLNGALLLLSLFDERQKPTNQKNQNGDNDEDMQHPIEQLPEPLLMGFIKLFVTGPHSRILPSVARVVT